MANPATSWLGQAQSFLGFAAKTFGTWAAHPAMEGARAANDAVGGPAGLAKCSAQVAASVLRHAFNAWDARADKADPQWVAWRAAWDAARDAVGGQRAGALLSKEATWGNTGALLVMCAGSLKLQATEASPIIIPRPNPPADHAWLRAFMRSQQPPPEVPPPVKSPPVKVPTSPDEPAATPDASGDDLGGILPLLLLFLL